MEKDRLELEDGTIVEGVNEIPEETNIFGQAHIDYVNGLTGHILLNDLKGQLLNIIEGIGLPERQETAIKRQVTNALHDNHHHIGESLELVKGSEQTVYLGSGKLIIADDSELSMMIERYLANKKQD